MTINQYSSMKSGAQAGLQGNLSNRARGKKALRQALCDVKKPQARTTTPRRGGASQNAENGGVVAGAGELEKKKDDEAWFGTPNAKAGTEVSNLRDWKKRVSEDGDTGSRVYKRAKRETAIGAHVVTPQRDDNNNNNNNNNNDGDHGKRVHGDIPGGGRRLTPLFTQCRTDPKKQKMGGNINGRVQPPMGFSNLGNTCYLNATIQCMLNVPDFVEEIQRLCSVENDHSCHKNTVTRALGEVIHTQKQVKEWGPDVGKKVGDLARVKAALELHFPSIFAGRNQQDAHECFVRILEALELEHPTRYTCPFSCTVSVEMRCKRCRHKTLREEKGHVDIGLELPLPLDSSCEHSVESLLASRYFKAERIQKNCDSCGEKDAIHGLRRRLMTPPKALVIHLKRFVFHIPTDKHHPSSLSSSSSLRWAPAFSKNSAIVEASQTLSRACLMVSCTDFVDMHLCGIVHHHGNHVESGHYVADVCRGEGSSWYRCNDSIVTAMIPPPALASSTWYMAVYSAHAP